MLKRQKSFNSMLIIISLCFADDVYRVEVAYGKLMHSATLVCSVCEERVLINASCYMFNTICGLFDTISAYRTRGAPLLLAIVHLSWVLNCAGRIALVCFAASSVVEQVIKYTLFICFTSIIIL